jgi:NADH:ubiquinone oxidoreductase subunit K
MAGAAASKVKTIAYMAVASATFWLCAAAVVDRRTSIEILFGMLGPLAAAVTTWVAADRVYRHRPEELTGVMATAFVLKMFFFAAYVALMLRVMQFRPVPFVASFTGYFIGLHFIEALFLKRLFSERPR